MQKLFSQALCAALLLAAYSANVAASTVQGMTLAAPSQPTSIGEQMTTSPVMFREGPALAKNDGTASRATFTAAHPVEESNSGAMLFGGLAIMAIMVRRRLKGRD